MKSKKAGTLSKLSFGGFEIDEDSDMEIIPEQNLGTKKMYRILDDDDDDEDTYQDYDEEYVFNVVDFKRRKKQHLKDHTFKKSTLFSYPNAQPSISTYTCWNISYLHELN